MCRSERFYDAADEHNVPHGKLLCFALFLMHFTHLHGTSGLIEPAYEIAAGATTCP